ncbi:MAG: hypothetical protein J6X60_08555 [Ruminiclostridium sp.]|nr:hypothetical protein [Ruminiclostridium sp.]
MTCPRCGNNSCQLIDEVKEKSWDEYEDPVKSGYFFLGPWGVLIKRIINGKNSKGKHQNYWVCNKCGKEWKA